MCVCVCVRVCVCVIVFVYSIFFRDISSVSQPSSNNLIIEAIDPKSYRRPASKLLLRTNRRTSKVIWRGRYALKNIHCNSIPTDRHPISSNVVKGIPTDMMNFRRF